MAYAERKLQLHRLLLSPELRTHAGEVFLDRYVELINLSASGQLAMRKMFEDHLQRVEWDEWQFPVRVGGHARRLTKFQTSPARSRARLLFLPSTL